MTRDEAREVLLAWRPGLPDDADPSLAEALALATQDPELAAWLADHRAFQERARDALRSIPVPADLADRILERHRILRPRFPRQLSAWKIAVAILVVLAGLLAIWLPTETEDNRFTTFRSRMVRAAIREYRMDVKTNNLAAIRGFMASHQAPADFELAPPLARLTPLGGGLLSWHGERVAMVCLDGGRLGTVFLFVTPTHLVQEGPPAAPMVEPVSRLVTASWSRGGRTYVLAVGGTVEDLRALL